LEEFGGGVGFSFEVEFGASSTDGCTVREDNSAVGGLVESLCTRARGNLG